MKWKKVVESKDLIVLEKDSGSYKLKIEARKNSEGWEVFVTKIKEDSSNLISEYMLDDKKDVTKLIEKLKSNKFPRSNIKTKVRTHLKRVYKEEFIEKWHFFVGDKRIKNFVLVKFDNNIDADVVMHEKFKPHEKTIISQIEEKLGLDELGESISYEIYYFTKNNKEKKKNEYSFDYIDIEFKFDD